jgi:uncharacterized membrane protein
VTKRRTSASRMVLLLFALGSVATGFAATASTWANVETCGHDPSGECSSLVRTLSLRVGLVVGVATVLMLLLVAGLHRMIILDERRRAIEGHPDLSE